VWLQGGQTTRHEGVGQADARRARACLQLHPPLSSAARRPRQEVPRSLPQTPTVDSMNNLDNLSSCVLLASALITMAACGIGVIVLLIRALRPKKTFTCKGCKHKLPKAFVMRTPGFC